MDKGEESREGALLSWEGTRQVLDERSEFEERRVDNSEAHRLQ